MLTRSLNLRLQKTDTGGWWIGVVMGLTLLAIAIATALGVKKIPFEVDCSPPQPLGVVMLVVGLCGIAGVILGFLRRSAAAVTLNVLTTLGVIVFSLSGDARRSLDRGISARAAASYAISHIQEPQVGHIYTFGFNRSFRYGLSFYLHQETVEWSEYSSRDSLILTNYRGEQMLRLSGVECLPSQPEDPIVVCKAGDLARGKTPKVSGM
jgi:hypothetical protein